ncbi:MAG: endonuclease domain-containing protein [Saprospiraceae bacterium]|nr:endonuclease domain-containing protein [Saprospiraceae bacterium]
MDDEHNPGMHAGAKPELFRFAARLIEDMTKPEKILWSYLRQKPFGYKFRRQHPLSEYILDFYCHRVKLSLEIDGEYHNSEDQIELDKTRTDNIRQLGIHELRFTNETVLETFESVRTNIDSFLQAIDKSQDSS